MYLSFEKEIQDKSIKLQDLRDFVLERGINLDLEINKLEKEIQEDLKNLYSNLTKWQKVQVARHPQRPTSLDYIEIIFTDFVELHGDRLYKDDLSVVGGLAKLDDQPVIVLGNQRGKNTKENLKRNFGMANPEGYRKILRLMRLASNFSIPLVTFIDTKGAYPGIEAEKHGQGEAIARNLAEMFGFKVPIISIVIGEGGSGGALGLGVADRICMLENSFYSVISPEGAASILFKDSTRVEEMVNCLQVNAKDLHNLEIADEIIPEPVGGAHRNLEKTAENLKLSITKFLKENKNKKTETLLKERYEKFRKMGLSQIIE